MSSQDLGGSLKHQDQGVTLRELQEELSNLRRLSQSAEFQLYLHYLEGQCELRKQQVFLTPLTAMDEVLGQEYVKGEIAGLHHAGHIVTTRIADLQDQIQAALKETENENSEVQADGGNTGDGRLDLDTFDPKQFERPE